MRIDVFTLFPQLVDNFCSESLLGRARNEKLVDVRSHDLREHTTDVHHSVDDAPFGGGAGMVLRAEPVFESFEKSGAPRPLLLLSPGGKPFDQAFANKLASLEGFSLLCGRYEGVDHRIREHLVDEEVSVGDVVLAGGEVGACLIIEAVTRLLPGVMGNAMSPITEMASVSVGLFRRLATMATTMLLCLGLIARSTSSTSPSKMPASRMDSPRTVML